jgi:hypothetical protein
MYNSSLSDSMARIQIPRSLAAVIAIGLAALVSGASPAAAEMHRVLLDGVFGDWEGLAPIWEDPVGDGGPSGIDIGAIWAAEDEESVFLRFEVGCDLIIQNEYHQLTLYLDTDCDPLTGYPLGELGAELVWDFGPRAGYFFHGSAVEISWADIGLISAPTFSGPQFEVRLARNALPDGVHPLFPGPAFRVQLRDWQGGGDWAPDLGEYVEYTLDQGAIEPLEPIFLERPPTDVRLITYNVLQDGIFDYGPQQAFRRILEALDPDVIAFQEIYNHNLTETLFLIEEMLGGSWDARKVSDKVLLTRSQILGYWSIAGGRAGAFLIAPLGEIPDDALIINAHLSCCDNDPARQAQVDAIMAFVRDAKTPGGELDLTSDNPIVITGDMNFVGLSRQLETLLTGDIEDEITYGPDFAPDWDDTDLTDLISRQPLTPMAYTWSKEWSSYSPGRLDFIIFTDSNLALGTHAILQTEKLPTSYLDTYGLLASDTGNASDHLPFFGDLIGGIQDVAELPFEMGTGLRLRLAGPNPSPGGGAQVLLELSGPPPASLPGQVTVSVHDTGGRLVRILADARIDQLLAGGIAGYSRRLLAWDGNDGRGRPAAPGSYWVRLSAGNHDGALRVILLR